MEAWQSLDHILIRCGVAVVLLSVWTWRFNRSTSFRGKQAKTMAEEFAVYGLSRKTMYLIGFLKILISLCFLCGNWVPFLIRPAAIALVFLMTMAVLYHLKIEKDKLVKAGPAYLILFFASYLMVV